MRGGWGGYRRQVGRWFIEATGGRPTVPGAATDDDVADHAKASGWQVENLPEIRASRTIDLLRYVDELEAGIFSSTWTINSTDRARAAAITRERIAAESGDDTVREDIQTIVWRKYTC